MKIIGGALALTLAAFAAPVGLILATMPAKAQPGTDVNGWNVEWVTIGNGSFRKQADGSWAELDANQRPVFRFTETNRDEWSVYLNDSSRDVQLQLDLFRRKVTYGVNGGDRSDLYDIVAARRAPPAPPAPPRPRVQPAPTYAPPPQSYNPPPAARTRNVNAGPIWNQRDAELKCPVVGFAVGGRWTGAWRTVREGQMSVCEISQN